jgi:adenylate kinase family enzyme
MACQSGDSLSLSLLSLCLWRHSIHFSAHVFCVLRSNDIVLDVLESSLRKLRFQRSHGLSPPVVLLDGFPLSNLQRQIWEEEESLPHFSGVFFLDAPEETMVERVLARGKLAEAAGKLRQDDNEHAASSAIAHFHAQGKPLVEHYAKDGRVAVIDAMGTVDSCLAAIRSNLLNNDFGGVNRNPALTRGLSCKLPADRRGQ